MQTAIKLTQSRELQVMLKDYTLVENRDPSYPFIYELGPAWTAEVEKQKNPLEPEKMIEMSNNSVP